MPKFSRQKGLRTERELVNLLRDRGIPAERVAGVDMLAIKRDRAEWLVVMPISKYLEEKQ